MTSEFYKDFQHQSEEDWKKAVEKELKGKNFNDFLVAKTLDGIELQAFLTGSSIQRDKSSVLIRQEGNDWEVNEKVKVQDVSKANKRALEILNEGISSLTFSIQDKVDFDQLLKEVGVEYIVVNLEVPSGRTDLVEDWSEWLQKKGFEKNSVRGAIYFSGLDHFLSDVLKASELLKEWTLFRSYTVQSSVFHDKGAGSVQEIAFALAQGNDALHLLVENGFAIDDAVAQIGFELGCGVDYFSEIAKIRAFRVLWREIVNAYQPIHACSSVAWIKARTSQYWQSAMDLNTNLLRNSTQAMSAVIGGVNELEVRPYDELIKEDSSFGLRLARNVQLILKEESYLHTVSDPAGGSLFLEELTRLLEEKSWVLFLQAEDKGGFLKAYSNGWVMEQINKNKEEKETLLREKKIKQIGVNVYQNTKENLLDSVLIKDSNRLSEVIEKEIIKEFKQKA